MAWNLWRIYLKRRSAIHTILGLKIHSKKHYTFEKFSRECIYDIQDWNCMLEVSMKDINDVWYNIRLLSNYSHWRHKTQNLFSNYINSLIKLMKMSVTRYHSIMQMSSNAQQQNYSIFQTFVALSVLNLWSSNGSFMQFDHLFKNWCNFLEQTCQRWSKYPW